MIRFETEQTIARSAGDIWTYAADIVRHAEWMGVADAQLLQGVGTEVGARARERLVMGPFRWDVDLEVSEAVPERRIVWRSLAGAPFHGEIALDLAPVGPNSTRATYGAAIQMHGLWRLLAPGGDGRQVRPSARAEASQGTHGDSSRHRPGGILTGDREATQSISRLGDRRPVDPLTFERLQGLLRP